MSTDWTMHFLLDILTEKGTLECRLDYESVPLIPAENDAIFLPFYRDDDGYIETEGFALRSRMIDFEAKSIAIFLEDVNWEFNPADLVACGWRFWDHDKDVYVSEVPAKLKE